MIAARSSSNSTGSPQAFAAVSQVLAHATFLWPMAARAAMGFPARARVNPSAMRDHLSPSFPGSSAFQSMSGGRDWPARFVPGARRPLSFKVPHEA